MLRAYIDDSGKERDSFSIVLAGYLASADRWASFSNEWQAILNECDLTNFHMVDAWRLSREYKKLGTIGRNNLILSLIGCITKYVENAFVLSIEEEAFRHWYVRDEHPDVFATRPYFLAFHGITTMISDYVYKKRDDHDFSIVFDEQGGESTARVLASVEDLRLAAKEQGRPSMRIPTPQFMSDDGVPPLQAADLLAWLCRRENHNYRIGINWSDTAEHILLDQAMKVPNTVLLLGDKKLEALSKDTARRLEAVIGPKSD